MPVTSLKSPYIQREPRGLLLAINLNLTFHVLELLGSGETDVTILTMVSTINGVVHYHLWLIAVLHSFDMDYL